MEKYLKNYSNDSTYSYRRIYHKVVKDGYVDYTPEVNYFTNKAGLPDVFYTPHSFGKWYPFNFTYIMENMYTDKDIFSHYLWSTLLQNQYDNKVEVDDKYKLFNTDQFKSYMRYTTKQAGLGGLFTTRPPKQIIEGYTDHVLDRIVSAPMYQEGDNTISSFVTLQRRVDKNELSFFIGGNNGNDYLKTRQLIKW